MDEPTYGDGTLRFMKASKARSNKNKSLENNYQTIWKIGLFSSITACLAVLLINKGWEPIYKEQIKIIGVIHTPLEKIIDAMGVNFPIKLLEVSPKQLEQNLERKLAIKSVAIRRRITPLGIDIEILEKEPIAIAFRVGEKGQEKGMLDKEGFWIDIYPTSRPIDHENPVIVNGWKKSKKKLIALILKKREELEISLERIILNPNGSISLQTNKFILVHLGNQPELINQQLEALAHLSKSLSSDVLGEEATILDLKNPYKPKLFFPKKRK